MIGIFVLSFVTVLLILGLAAFVKSRNEKLNCIIMVVFTIIFFIVIFKIIIPALFPNNGQFTYI